MRNLLERSRRLEIGQAGRAAVYASLHAQTVGANARRLISDLLYEKLAAGSGNTPIR